MSLPTFTRDSCPTCRAAVILCVTTTGSPASIDFEPVADGDIAIEHRGAVIPLARKLTVTARFGRTGLRKSHNATCPKRGRA